MIEIQDNAGTISGAIIAALFILGGLLSKFRVWWNKDTTEANIAAATTAIIQSLRDENQRLHQQVMQLQQEVSKLQVIISELTVRQTHLQIREEEALKASALAKQGLIDRRSNKI